MSNLPPFKQAVSSVSSDGDDDDDYMSATSNIMPSPPPARPISQHLQQRQLQSQQQQMQPPPPPPPPQQGKSVPSDGTQSATSPPNKSSPPKPALTTRASTTGGTAQRPPKPYRGRSVGFVDDLKITTSSSSDLGGNVTKEEKAATQQNQQSQQQQQQQQQTIGLPRPGIISQRKTSYDSVNRSSFRSTNSSSAGSSTKYTVDQVIASQFENEATTHILQALEAAEMDEELDRMDSMERGRSEHSSRLLGEGIDDSGYSGTIGGTGGEEAGMADYSEDEDEDHGGIPAPPHGRDSGSLSSSSSGPYHVRQDSFLQRVHMQNDQAQYKFDPYSPRPGSDGSSPERQVGHRRGVSSASRSSGYLPSVPDDAALATSGAGASSQHHKDVSAHGGSNAGKDINYDDDGEDAPPTRGTATNSDVDANNTATLANRLRYLQRGVGSFGSRRSSFRSTSSSEVGAGALGAEPESYSDKLIDALSRADQPKHKQWWRRVRSEYKQLIAPKIPLFQSSISYVLLFIIFPCLAVAAILFYLVGNPDAGNSNTSWSWWILFLGVRQMITFEFTRIGEIFWIEIMALRSSFFNMIVGPYVSLAIIQSKGWPYIFVFWPVINFCFLYGSHSFAKHWLFWQNKLDIFNETNPVEGITDNEFYLRLLCSMMFIGIAVSLKRLTIALYLGKRTVQHFGDELEKLMAKMILIGEVATLAKNIEGRSELFQGVLSPLNEDADDEKMVRFNEFVQNDRLTSSDIDSPGRPKGKVLVASPVAQPPPPPPAPTASFDGASPVPPPRVLRSSSAESLGQPPRSSPEMPSSSDSATKKEMYTSAANAKLIYLLSEWEEPEIINSKHSKVSVQDLVQFRKAVSYMDDKCPFSHAFGPAKTRVLCVESAQKVYDKLMLSTDFDAIALPFSVFAVLATDENGELVDTKMKSLIRLFRPDRQGTLTKLDFVKSIDAVYKQMRLLRASIANSAQIDVAFERIVNFFFYFFMVVIAVAILGINIWKPFLSVNTFFLTFSILYKDAASNYFEGLLLIFNRRPYDIGDRIATSQPMKDTSPDGSSTWFVDRVTLFTTTVRFATTNEVATYSNGSLASLRIINANRSPKAILSVVIKFGLETPFQRISVFRTAVENFVKARPREWAALVGFRATRVEADMGFVEYKIVCQHREAWQNIGAILESKADLASFCLEVTKKLGMRYESPPMPVNLSANSSDLRGLFEGQDDDDQDDSQMRGGVKSMSADDLKDVAALFAIEK